MTISVVTVVRNGVETISDCLESVRSQSFRPQHLVIDGQSTDGTLKILKRAADWGVQFTTEPDRGIYDGMSKGVSRANGDIIGILNADDFYASSDVLEAVADAFSDEAIDTCYGDLLYVASPAIAHRLSQPRIRMEGQDFVLPGERLTRRWIAGTAGPRAFYWGWMPPHPTFFVRRSVYDRLGYFRLDLGTSADYELMLRFLLKHRISTLYIPKLLVKMRVGGVSNVSLRNRWAAHRNDHTAWTVNGLKPYPWTLLLKPLLKIGQWI